MNVNAALALALAACSPALAQHDAPAPDAAPAWTEDQRWTIRFEPGLWYVGLGGDLTLPRDAEDAGGNEPTSLRDLGHNRVARIAPLGEVTLRRGSWGLALRGTSITGDETAAGVEGRIGEVDIADGDPVSSSVDLLAVEVEGLYTLVREARRPMEGGGYALRPRLDAVFGARVVQSDWSVLNAASDESASADEVGLHPLVGVKGALTLYERFTIDLQITAGWMPFLGSSSYGLDIVVGGAWEITPHVGVQVGYRALFLGLSSGDGDAEFEFSGSAQGLYAGVVIAF